MNNKSLILIGSIIVIVLLLVNLNTFLIEKKIPNVAEKQLGGNFAYQLCDSGDSFGTSSILGMNSDRNNGGLWLTANATSTLTCNTKGAVSVDLNLYLVGSSTTHTLYWEYAFNKATETPEGVVLKSGAILGSDSTDDLAVWYVEDTKTVLATGEVNHSIATTTHNWAPGVATSTRNVTVPLVASDWMQIRFSVSGANAALYGEVVKKEPVN